uniref:Uncharacterized protein n=1 Tax=Clastoptera arizonana TaxID=38151 RepID=A0A1B6EDU9_9HEMI
MCSKGNIMVLTLSFFVLFIQILQINTYLKKNDIPSWVVIMNSKVNNYLLKRINEAIAPINAIDPQNSHTFFMGYSNKLKERNSGSIENSVPLWSISSLIKDIRHEIGDRTVLESRRKKSNTKSKNNNNRSRKEKYEAKIHEIAKKIKQKGNKIVKKSRMIYDSLATKNKFNLNRLGKMSNEEFHGLLALQKQLKNIALGNFKAFMKTLNITATQTKAIIGETFQDIKEMSDVLIEIIDLFAKKAEVRILKGCENGNVKSLPQDLSKELNTLMYSSINSVWDVFNTRKVNAKEIQKNGIALLLVYLSQITQDFKLVQTTVLPANDYIEYVLKNVHLLGELMMKKFQTLKENCFQLVQHIINHNDKGKNKLIILNTQLFHEIAKCSGNYQNIKSEIIHIKSTLRKSNIKKYYESIEIMRAETANIIKTVHATIIKVGECGPNSLISSC